MIRHVISTLFFVHLLISCTPDAGLEQVEIITSGIFEDVTYISIGGDDLGEHLISQDPIIHRIYLKNNAKFPLTDLDLIISDEISADMKFVLDGEGKSVYPGIGGSCSRILAPGRECFISLQYTPRVSGAFKQKLTLSYKNYIESIQKEKILTVVAGEAASLFFTSETTSYGFGVIERTERVPRYEILDVKNGGGLPAKNIRISQANTPEGFSYRIVENNCPDTLWMGQTCQLKVEFLPQNYGSDAPDGNEEDINYSSKITFDYMRDSSGTAAQLNGYFITFSTSIRGKIETSGLANFQFPETIAGNRVSAKIKVNNNGYKEAIFRAMHFRDEAGNKIATCIKKAEGVELECRRPNMLDDSSSKLPLSEFPFFVKDLRNCFDTFDKMDYERLSDNTLSKDVRTVFGKSLAGDPGDYCVFEVFFQPSLTYLNLGGFSNIDIIFEYDSTWKNLIDIKNNAATADNSFTIVEANYLSAARVVASDLEYSTGTFSIVEGATDSFFPYNVGRIALITDVTYKQKMKVPFVNLGNTEAKILAIKDGKGNLISEMSADINPYYLQTSHSCNIVDANSGVCALSTYIAPVTKVDGVLLTEPQRKEYMYDDTDGLLVKKFTVEYLDGALYNDDMTPRESQKIEVEVASSLIEKGYLVFVDGQTDNIVNVVGKNTNYKTLLIKNVGTGTIPYITYDPSSEYYDTTCSDAKTKNLPCAFEFVDTAGPMGGADADCYDIVTIVNDLPLLPPGGYIPPVPSKPGLPSEQSCSLTYRLKLRNNDVVPIALYDNIAYSEKERDFTWDYSDPTQNWESLDYSYSEQQFTFMYLDGDSVADPDEGYYPQIATYGNWMKIIGGNAGKIGITPRYQSVGKLIPDRTYPHISAVVYRPSIQIAPIYPLAEEWGDPVDPGTSSLASYYYTEVEQSSGFFKQNLTNLKNASNWSRGVDGVDIEGEYAFTGGYFPADGTTYKFGFALCNLGDVKNILYSASYAPNDPADTGKLVLASGSLSSSGVALGVTSCRVFDFNFKPTENKDYSGLLNIQYANGTLDESGALVRLNKHVRINAYGVSSNAPMLKIMEQDYLVEYDAATATNTATLQGDPLEVGTKYNEAPVDLYSRLKAIKGSNSYSQKQYTITNTGNTSMRKINIALQQSETATSDLATGSGYTIPVNNCQGVTLAPGASCTIDFRYQPSASAPSEVVLYFAIRYSLEQAPNASELYISKMFRARLYGSDPAKMGLLAINPMNLPGGIQGAYGINLGTYSSGTHIVLNNHPKTVKTISTIKVVNSNTEKGSFLKQYRDFVGVPTAYPPADSTSIKIFANGSAEVFANRFCFYGDDENDSSIEASKKGYSKDSIDTCILSLTYYADATYAAGEISNANNVIPLKYYNNERASSDIIYLYLSGFVEPNRVLYSSNPYIFDVSAISSGKITFSWSAMNAVNPLWGDIVGYKVFYGKTKSPFSNVFTTTSLMSVNLTAKELNTATITGLSSGTYYYFLIAAVRNVPGRGNLISIVNKTPFFIPVPPLNMLWDSSTNFLIDTYLSPLSSPTMLNKVDGVNLCSISKISVSNNGVNKSYAKKLIDTAVYELIESNYVDLSNYQFSYVPHWVSDAPVDVSLIFQDAYSPSATSGQMIDADGNQMFYIKPCTDDSCRFLSKVLGGDGEDIPPGSTIYISDEAINAGIRCYVKLE